MLHPLQRSACRRLRIAINNGPGHGLGLGNRLMLLGPGTLSATLSYACQQVKEFRSSVMVWGSVVLGLLQLSTRAKKSFSQTPWDHLPLVFSWGVLLMPRQDGGRRACSRKMSPAKLETG